jgi:hypothetical protein
MARSATVAKPVTKTTGKVLPTLPETPNSAEAQVAAQASTAKPKAKRNDAWRKLPLPSDEQVITVTAEKNPKRGDSAVRFAAYRSGMTVKEFREVYANNAKAKKAEWVRGGLPLANADLRWDLAHNFISVK